MGIGEKSGGVGVFSRGNSKIKFIKSAILSGRVLPILQRRPFPPTNTYQHYDCVIKQMIILCE
jgi:hypothetical protein